jgi:hypothetical protein
MADDDLDDEELEIDDEDLADDELEIVDDAVDEVVVEPDADVDVLEEEEGALEGAAPEVPARPARKGKASDDDSDEDEDDVVDLEEEHHPDDVEDPLDVLLKERTTAERLDEDEAEVEDDELEPDDRTNGSGKVVPRRDDEFLCRSCFLVKPLSQLARGEKDLCRDCE